MGKRFGVIIKIDEKFFTRINQILALLKSSGRFLKDHLRFKKPGKHPFIKTVIILLVILGLIGSGAAFGVYMAIRQNLPSIDKLEKFEPGTITYIYADNGEVIGEFALEKRIEIDYKDIPENMIHAIIATEDPRFYKHKGIDILGILRAVKEDIKILGKAKLHGGSTISQQLARELFLHRRQTLRRKFKEAILSLQIERRYSKEDILKLYCNQFYLGHGAYGVEALSRVFFDKSVLELNLVETALITGVFRGPSVYSPYFNTERTLQRRNHVLNRMRDEGYITEEEYETAKQEPMEVLPLQRKVSEFAANFNEEVRQHLEATYGVDALYRGGLKVYTTLNPDYQRHAENAIKRGLHILDKRQGWRMDKVNLIERDILDIETITKPVKDPETNLLLLESWLKNTLEVNDIIEAIVTDVRKTQASVKIKDYTGTLSDNNIGWTETKDLRTLIKKGDVIQVKLNTVDEDTKQIAASLDQEPLLEGAFLAIEPQTGQIKTMVGGYSFKRLKFNQAIQAKRQSGSVIKPLLYTAALENGFTPATVIVDEPYDFLDKWADEPYSPPNYDEKFKGAVSLRTGLEESRNIVTTKLLEYISPQTGVDYCKKFGITTPIYPYLSLALGAFEVRLIELVSAFSTYPNKGVRIHPYFITRIEDKEGNILEESRVRSEEVISPQIAYIMTSLLQGVVQRGSGWRARYLEKALAGKTGTTDDYSDAWFVGFSPALCAGVWVGYKEGRITIGEKQSGAVAAHPIWVDFFDKVIAQEKLAAEEREEEYVREEFEIPANLIFVQIDRKTGLLASPICLPQYILKEVFLPGTEPNRYCTYEDHMKTLDYYDTLRLEQE